MREEYQQESHQEYQQESHQECRQENRQENHQECSLEYRLPDGRVIDITDRVPTPAQYNALRLSSGMSRHEHDPERVRRAFAGSAYIVSAWAGEELVGFGRIVGDGGICFNVNDIMVNRQFQRQGVADRIMAQLDTYLDREADEYCFVALIARRPADHIYARHRFEYLDPDRRYGMLRHQDDRPTGHYSPM